MKSYFTVSTEAKSLFLVQQIALAIAGYFALILTIFFFMSTWAVFVSLFASVFYSAYSIFRINYRFSNFSARSLEFDEAELIYTCLSEPRAVVEYSEIQSLVNITSPWNRKPEVEVRSNSRKIPLHIFSDHHLIIDRIRKKTKTPLKESYEQRLFTTESFTALLIFIVAATVSLVFALNTSENSHWLLFIAGLLFISFRPAQRLINEHWSIADLGLGTLILTVFSIFFMTQTVLPLLASNEDASPCDKGSMHMRCYHMTPPTCSPAWKRAYNQCEQEIRFGASPAAPSALIGPRITLCQWRLFDQAFKYNRREVGSNADCKELFKKIDSK